MASRINGVGKAVNGVMECSSQNQSQWWDPHTDPGGYRLQTDQEFHPEPAQRWTFYPTYVAEETSMVTLTNCYYVVSLLPVK